MNREIKFRGLMTTGEMVYGLPSYDLPNSTLYYNECNTRICWQPETGGSANAPIKNGTLSQYTGLTDKNGKEIYEGDIVQTDDYSKGAFFGTNQPTKKVLIEYGELTTGIGFELLHKNSAVVIVNIYSNPELL